MAQKLDRSYFGTGNRKTATGTNKKDTSGASETVQKLDRSHFNKPESAPAAGAFPQKKTAPATAPVKKQSGLPMDNVGRKNTANSRLLQDIQKRETRDTGNTPSFADRVTNTVKGGAKSSAAAYTNVGGVLAEGAGYLNTRIANQNAGAALQSDHDAVKQYEKMLRDVKWADGKPMTAVDVQQVQKYLSAAKRRIAAQEGYTKAVEQSDKEVADKAYRKADELAGRAQADLERAKEGAGFLGNMLVDAGASMTQTGLDAIPSILTGGALGMAPFAVRAFGGATQQARQDGADYKGQLLYGTASAAKEVFTEKMFNIALPFAKAYGGGALDDVVERGIRSAVDKFAKTEAGKKALGSALTFGAGAVGEGLEEFIGDWMEWQLPRIYGGDVATAQETLSDSLYDFLVGATSGAMGGIVSPNTYRYDLGTAQQGVQEHTDVQEGTRTATTQTNAQAQQEGTQRAIQEAAQRQTVSNPVSMEEQVLRQREAAVQKTFTGIADKLGDSGRKAFQTAYQGTDRGDYAGEFLRAYHAGMTNQENPNSTSAVSFAAYTAGQNDAAASLAREKRAAQFAKTAGTDSGLVFDDYVSQKMNSTIADEVNTVAKALGVRVQMVDQVLGGSANGDITGSEIRIARDAQDPVLQVVGHEWTHRVQELAPEQYRSFRDAVASIPDVQEAAQILLEQYNRHGVETSYEQALDEATANYAGEMIANSDVLDDFIRKHSTDRTLLQKLRDAIHEIVGKLTGRAKRQAQTVEGKLQAAFEAASKQAESLQNRQANGTISETRYAAKEGMDDGRERAQGDGTFAQEAGQNREGNRAVQESAGEILRGDAVLRRGQGGLNASFGQKPARSWAEGHTVEPSQGSVAYTEQQTAANYGVPSFVVDDAAWAKNKGNAPAFSSGGQIYFRETMPEQNRGMYATHEITHVMKQVGYTPYLDFVSKTPDMLDMSTLEARILLEHTAKHRGIDPLNTSLSETERINLYDELNATLYGHISSGNMGGLNEILNTAFYDFSAYVKELNELHERFKSDNQKKAKENTRFSLKTPVEETDKLIAVHNKDEASIMAALKLGGLPMPSIAIVKARDGHTKYGPISLVFSKDTIDPQLFRANKVYGGDAWTPTAPRVDYPVNSKKASQVEHELHRLAGDVSVAGGIFGNSAALRSVGIDDTSTRSTAELAEKLASTDTVRAAYLADQGKSLEPVKMDKVWDKFGNDTLQKVVDRLGVNTLAEIEANLETGESVKDALGENAEVIRDILRDYYREQGEPMLRRMAVKRHWTDAEINERRQTRIDNSMDGVSIFTLEDIVHHAWDMYQDGGATKGEIDRMATSDALRSAVDDHAVEEWIAGKLDGLLGEAGIYNGKDPYTPSGNLRSFSQLHYAYTLENIVKAMKEGQEERGGNTWGASAKTLQSVATPEYRSIQEIKADSGRLGMDEGAEYEAKLQAIDDQIGSIITKIKQGNKAHSDNSFVESDIIGSILMETSKGKRTVDAIMRAFSKEGYKISSQTAQDIQAVYQAAAEMPTGYFEAKPRRAVGFDEVLAAVIPDDSSEKLRDGLEQAGVRMLEYKTGDDADRLAKINSVDDAKFSLKGTENAQEIAALKRENESLKERVEYWKGQTRRSQGVTTDRKSVQKAADALVKDYGAEISGSDIAGDLQSLYDYIASGKDGRDELTYAEARRRSDAIAERIAESAVEVDDRAYKEYAGLRKYLKDTKLTLTEADAAEITDFNEFRKSLFGKLKISKGEHTNVDQIYSELSSQYPEFFNEAQDTNISDQVQRIADVANRLYKVTEYNPFEGYMGQAVASISNDIMDRFFDLPQTKKTFADRAAEQVQEARFQGRQAANDAFLAGQMAQGKQDAKRLRSTAQALAKERTRRAEQVQALKERYREKDVTRRDNQKRRELRAKIVRHASALSQKLLRPTDNQHIPEKMRSAVAKVLESINQESGPNARSFTLDPVTKERIYKEPGTPTNRTVAFQNLKEQYQKIAQDGDMVVDPFLLGGDDVAGGFSEVIKMGDTRLADLTTEQLKTMWNVLKSVEHSVTTAGKTLASEKFATTKQFADALRMDGMTRRRKLGNNVAISLETPYTFFAHFGQTGKDIYRMLRNAQDRQEIMARDVAEKVHQILGDAKTGIRENAVTAMNEEVHHFTTTEGRELDLTTAQAMELYLLSERKQAEDHLLKGGIVQPEIKIPRKTNIPRGTNAIHLSAIDIQNIVGVLTPEQIRIADGLQKLTTGVLANYGNEASMKAYGYKKFTEQDYWPIKSAEEELNSSPEKDSGNVRSIKNIGMAQAVNPKASNALEVRSVFSTFADHASDMIDYAAWLCPMEDANRLFNYKFVDEKGNKTGVTVKGLLEEKGGKGTKKYWRKLMGDIQNGINAKDFEPLTDLAGKPIGWFKAAAVGANLRVVIQQPTAFFRASAVLDPADMARGLTGGVTKGNGWEKALTHSPIAMRKDVGSFDISSPYTLNDRFYGKEGIANKINDKAGAPAGKADAVTWGALWNACEWQVKRERPNLRAGSGEFYSAVNEVFTSMIDQTQVVDGILQRSNIMRGKSDLAKQATSFMGEPIMSLNVFMRAWDNMRYEENPAKRSKAIKTVGRAAAALLVTDVVNAIAQSIMDANRDDDPDKDYWEKLWTAFWGLTGDEKNALQRLRSVVIGGNLGSNINKVGSVPFAKDILSIISGYGVSRTDMEVAEDIINASKSFIDSMGDNGKKTRAEALSNVIAAGAKLAGLPVSNLKRELVTTVRTAIQATGNVAIEYEYEKLFYNIYGTSNKDRYMGLAFKALEQGDLTTYEHIRKELKDFMAVDSTSVDSGMRSRLAKKQEKDGDYRLPQNAASLIGAKDSYDDSEGEDKFTENDLSSDDYIVYSRRKSELYSSMESGLEDSQVFRAFTDEQKDKALSSAETYAKKTALHETDKTYEITDKWVLNAQEAQKKYGIKPEIYVALKTQVSDLESVKDRNGETIPNSKGLLIMQAVYNMPGLSEKQRNALFEYLGVGKSIRHYNKALVNEKVRKNARLAGK